MFGGADFGAGFWALLAGGGERGERPRELIDWAIGPVWEANHVWLIFVLVVLWTAFSDAFESILSTLFIPLSLAALGIVLRGAGFAFQKLGAAGCAAGVVGRVPVRGLVGAHAVLHGNRRGRDRLGPGAGRQRGRRPRSRAGSTRSRCSWGAVRRDRRLPVRGVPDQRRAPGRRPRDLERYFTSRAIAAALAAGALAIAGIFVLHDDARYVYDRLTSEALPLACSCG